MYLENPKYHEGSFEAQTGELEQLGRWMIDLPRGERDVFYSIALAALFHSAQNEGEFEVTFETLFSPAENVNSEELQEGKLLIKRFNPFLNKYSCFKNPVLKSLIRDFKNKIFSYLLENKANKLFCIPAKTNFMLNPPGDGGEEVIKAACNTLGCKIAVVSSDGKRVKFFTKSDETNSDDCNVLLTLYQENISEDGDKVHFRFGLDTNIGFKMQKDAMRIFLKRAGIPYSVINEISSLCNLQTNLLQLLLSNRKFGTIKVLFKQPYIVCKLQEAGYNIHPLGEDSDGKTGLFYAMEKGNNETLSAIYDFLSGAFKWDDLTPRNPDKFVLENLKELKTALETAIKKFEDLSELKKREKNDKIAFGKELIKFNGFQADICAKIIRSHHEHSKATEKVAQAEARKQLIISILFTYEEHSNMGEDNNEAESYEKYLHKRYNCYMEYWRFYNTLDLTTALLYFDKIFLLKEKLLLGPGEYEKVDSTFLYFVLCCSCYNETRSLDDHSKSLGTKKLWCIINFLERLKLEECLKDFKNLLEETKVSNQNITPCLPKSEVKTLTSLREIRDTFVLKRMMHYIELATEMDLEEDWKMGMLVIERALQVLGESVKLISDLEGSVSISESLLVSSFPLGTKRNITKIRDIFSHLFREQIFPRLEVEKKPELFKVVQKDLKNIQDKLRNILEIQKFRERKHIFQNGSELLYEQKTVLETLKRDNTAEYRKMKPYFKTLFSEILESDDREDSLEEINSMLIKRDSLQKCREENKKQRKDLGKLKTFFQKIQKELQESVTNLTCKKLVSEYQNNIDLHFQHLHQLLVKTKTDKISKALAKSVDYHLRCIQKILETIVEESNCFFEHGLHSVENLGLCFTFDENNAELSVKQLKSKLETVTNNVNAFYGEIVREIKIRSGTDSKTMNCLDFPGITELEAVLRSGHFYNLTDEEKQIILESASEKSKEIHEAKKVLIESLRSGNVLPSDSAAENIKKLHLKESKRKDLEIDYSDEAMLKNNLCTLENIKDYFGNLKDCLGNNKELGGKDFETISEALDLTESMKKLLRKVVEGQRSPEDDEVYRGKAFELLLDRITLLEELIIKSNHHIKIAWLAPKGKEATEHIKAKILWNYRRDPKLQAAVEMLVFDCMNLLKNNKDFRNFLRKSAQLLTGINVRDVLGHGNPLLETLNHVLDPNDLASEIISKALQLIDYREVLVDHVRFGSRIAYAADGTFQRICEISDWLHVGSDEEYPVTPSEFDNQ